MIHSARTVDSPTALPGTGPVAPARRARSWHRACPLLLAALAAWRTAQADSGTTPSWSLTGFGTLGVVASSEHSADFVTAEWQANGAGYTRNLSFAPDSHIGIQLDGAATDRLSGTLQVVTELQANGAYSPKVEWANLKFQLTQDIAVRAGRMALPVLMISDYRLVGFANTAIRPPIEAYGIIPDTSIDGVDASWRVRVGPGVNRLQALYGVFFQRYPRGGSVDVPNSWGFSDVYTWGPLTAHASYSRAAIRWRDPYSEALFNGLTQLGTAIAAIPGLGAAGGQLSALTPAYRLDGQHSSIVSLGVAYEQGPWFVQAEGVRMNALGFLPTNTAGYVTVGYRVGPFQPYATYSRLRSTDLGRPAVPAGLPPPLAGAATPLVGALQDLLTNQDGSQRTASLGLRWDVRSTIDLKVQVDEVRTGGNATGLLSNVQANCPVGARYHVLGVALDFVF